MTKEQLENIKERVLNQQEGAECIMDGGENYDGADGARYVLELCDICNKLIRELEVKL